ncbi:MAG: thioredoxin family protein, partial [Mucinivorans sp.]
MKKLLLVLAFAISGLVASAQSTGTIFNSGSLADGLAAAAKADKMVFVDVYTTWCGPCKFMSSTIFPSQEVGTVMNAKFVNMKIDAEKGEGLTVAQTYQVKAYPTMLILDNTGKELGRIVGSSRTPKDFVKVVNEK